MTKARRRQRKLDAQWNPEADKWKKYSRCKLCRRRFIVNNYPDRRARVDKHKIGGKIVCPWCAGRDGKFEVQLLRIVEKVANRELSYCNSPDSPQPDCKCLSCVAQRVLKAHDELPTLR